MIKLNASITWTAHYRSESILTVLSERFTDETVHKWIHNRIQKVGAKDYIVGRFPAGAHSGVEIWMGIA